MGKHSPLPWNFGKIEEQAIAGPDGFVIHRPFSYQEFGNEDLKLIIKAVNNHDRLMEFVKEISKHVSKAGYQPTCSPFCIHCEATQLLKTIEKGV